MNDKDVVEVCTVDGAHDVPEHPNTSYDVAPVVALHDTMHEVCVVQFTVGAAGVAIGVLDPEV